MRRNKITFRVAICFLSFLKTPTSRGQMLEQPFLEEDCPLCPKTKARRAATKRTLLIQRTFTLSPLSHYRRYLFKNAKPAVFSLCIKLKFSGRCTGPHLTLVCDFQVETKSGEEDEEILFKERAKLYRWDRDLGQWKERGVGDLKILFHPTKRFYRVLMRREQVLRVCANHTITQAMELKPMNASANALIWTATDYSGTRSKTREKF